jgi:hypothetical protein
MDAFREFNGIGPTVETVMASPNDAICPVCGLRNIDPGNPSKPCRDGGTGGSLEAFSIFLERVQKQGCLELAGYNLEPDIQRALDEKLSDFD